MKVRNYQIEILRILKVNGGCITGYNQLLKKGGFHPNTLTKYLKDMKKHNLITVTITNVRTGQSRYCVVQPDYERMFKDFTKDFKPIEEQLARKDLTSEERIFLFGNYIRLAFYKFESLNVATLYAEHYEFNKTRSEDVQKTKDRLWKMINDAILKIPLDERLRVINSLLTVSPDLLSLEEFRDLRKPHTRKTKFFA